MLKDYLKFNEKHGDTRAETMLRFYSDKHYRRIITLEFLLGTQRIDRLRYNQETLYVALDMAGFKFRQGENLLEQMAEAGMLQVGTWTGG